MKRIATIGNLLKKIHRVYGQDLIEKLEQRGFTDLRPSFLEILIYICENQGTAIKHIGRSCGLKKQTMTSHLNELKRRGHIRAQENASDQREQHIYLTEYGEKFHLALAESISELEKEYTKKIGDVELQRLQFVLENVYNSIEKIS